MISTPKLLLLAVLLIVLLLFLSPLSQVDFASIYFNQKDAEENNPETQVPPNDSISPIIFAEKTFKDGIHTYTGQIELPTPCHSLERDISIAGFAEEEVVKVNFSIIPPEEGILCAQVIAVRDFEVSFQASENAEITFQINNNNAVLVDPNDDEAFHVE
jgi:hypothetical protein